MCVSNVDMSLKVKIVFPITLLRLCSVECIAAFEIRSKRGDVGGIMSDSEEACDKWCDTTSLFGNESQNCCFSLNFLDAPTKCLALSLYMWCGASFLLLNRWKATINVLAYKWLTASTCAESIVTQMTKAIQSLVVIAPRILLNLIDVIYSSEENGML